MGLRKQTAEPICPTACNDASLAQIEFLETTAVGLVKFLTVLSASQLAQNPDIVAVDVAHDFNLSRLISILVVSKVPHHSRPLHLGGEGLGRKHCKIAQQ